MGVDGGATGSEGPGKGPGEGLSHLTTRASVSPSAKGEVGRLRPDAPSPAPLGVAG